METKNNKKSTDSDIENVPSLESLMPKSFPFIFDVQELLGKESFQKMEASLSKVAMGSHTDIGREEE